jgi:hypothetical protein
MVLSDEFNCNLTGLLRVRRIVVFRQVHLQRVCLQIRYKEGLIPLRKPHIMLFECINIKEPVDVACQQHPAKANDERGQAPWTGREGH